MKINLLNTDDLNIEDFEAYCENMYDGFDIIQKNHYSFVKYRGIDETLKMHLLQEMFDFFYLEEDYDRCGELNKWMSLVYTQEWIRSWIYKK
jgi:hypothetical protein